MTPYFINFGRNMCTSGADYKLENDNENVMDNEQYLKIRKIVIDNLNRSYEVGKLGSRPVSYKVGDVVWKKNTILSDATKGLSAKLSSKYVKCIVNRKIGTSSYELKNTDGKIIGIFSAAMLKG